MYCLRWSCEISALEILSWRYSFAVSFTCFNIFQRVAHFGRIGVCGANAAPHVVTLVEDHEPEDAATELQEMRDV